MDPYLNRWIQPDTIVPDPKNPQSLNRCSYVYNNPVRYADPDGHCAREDEACNEWADLIEEEWEGQVSIVRCTGDWGDACVNWTAEEMELLYETLSEYILGPYLDIGLIFVRVGDAEYGGLHTPSFDASGTGDKLSTISISDSGWKLAPALGLFDLFDFFANEDHFQGTIAHELTHAATWAHPEVLDSWMEVDQPWWRSLAVGTFYDWSTYQDVKEEQDAEAYERVVEAEYLAMTIAALMYDPWWNQGRK